MKDSARFRHAHTRHPQPKKALARNAGALGLTNPAVLFCAAIVIAAALYSLRWSYLLTPLGGETIAFLVSASIVILTSVRRTPFVAGRTTAARSPGRRATLLLTAYYGAAYIANRGIPIIQILRGDHSYNIYGFGIPWLHVAMLSLSGYIALKAFDHYLVTKERRALASFAWQGLLLGSLASRSAVMFLVIGSIYIYVRRRRGDLRRTAALGIVGAFVVAGFGAFGNVRLDFQVEQATGQAAPQAAVVNLSRATPAFAATRFPPGVLWTYLYITSPLANLDSAIRQSGGNLCGLSCDIPGLLVHQGLPDTLGDRVGESFGIEKLDKSAFLVAPDLTASTSFGAAVGYAGMAGAIGILLLLAGIANFSLARYRAGKLNEAGLAVLAVMLAFSLFENMWAYAPLSLQLMWALVDGAWTNRLRRARGPVRDGRVSKVTPAYHGDRIGVAHHVRVVESSGRDA